MENQDCEEASVYPCCSQSTFPYKQDVFELCIKRAIMELDRSTTYHLVSRTPGPRFDINDTIRAIVLEFQSTYLFTLAYEKMFQFYSEVGPVTVLHTASAAVRFGINGCCCCRWMPGSQRSCDMPPPASVTAGSSAAWSFTTFRTVCLVVPSLPWHCQWRWHSVSCC